MNYSRKITLAVLLVLFTGPLAFSQSEMLKGIVNNLAYFKQKKELKFLTNAKKSIDSLIKASPDTNNLQNQVYRAVINSSLLYVDSTNQSGQPENFFRQTIQQVDVLNTRKKIFKYQPEMDFSRECLANVYIRKGFAYMRVSDFTNAGAMFIKAHKYAPEFKPLNAYIAYTNNKLGNVTTAEKYYESVVKSDSTRADYIEAASAVFKAVGDTAKALEMVKRGRKLSPNDKSLLLDEAQIYNNSKDYTSLAPLLPQLLDFNSDNPDIVFVAANCYDHLKQYDKAETLYLRAIDLNSAAYEPIFNLGILYLKKSLTTKGDEASKNLGYATQWVEKANEISPNDVNCLQVLKMVYTKTGNTDQKDKINNQLKQLTNQ